MGLFTSLLTGAIGLTAWGSFLQSFYQSRTREDEIHFVTTEDGWRVACSRYQPRVNAQHNPVFLCHGLGSNRTTFDLTAEHSLASFLAEAGFDVWVVDLRGHGYSECPSWFNDRRFGWSFDDYLLKDIPAVLKHIRHQTGYKKVHWIGHSMGGMLLYAHLSRMQGAWIQSGVTVASGLDYGRSSSRFASLLKWRWLIRPLPALPYGYIALFLSPFAGRFHFPIERFLYWPDNIHSLVARKLLVNTSHAISTPVLRQLSTAFETGGLTWKNDSIRYLDDLKESQIPVLGIAGDRDLQCPIEAVALPIETMKQSKSETILFGPSEGHKEHYGHFDLLLGRFAKEEVFPQILAWLNKHDERESTDVHA